MQTDLANLRRSYTLKSLEPTDLASDPLEQFRVWFEEAVQAQVLEPNAMILATADAAGHPSARTVLLKELDTYGFVFYTNYESHKAHDLEAHPYACLLFVWLDLERQIRISGRTEKVDAATSEAYFHSRPRGSQIGAWASPQSSVVPDRAFLEGEVARFTAQFGDADPIPLPPHWGGYRVVPERIEFWQGRQNRLHDRLCYYLDADGHWQVERLAP
jgi:pyridoxamine 5'-phosphate oxidase